MVSIHTLNLYAHLFVLAHAELRVVQALGHCLFDGSHDFRAHSLKGFDSPGGTKAHDCLCVFVFQVSVYVCVCANMPCTPILHAHHAFFKSGRNKLYESIIISNLFECCMHGMCVPSLF